MSITQGALVLQLNFFARVSDHPLGIFKVQTFPEVKVAVAIADIVA